MVRVFLEQLSPEGSRLAMKASSAQLSAVMKRCCSVLSNMVVTGHMQPLTT